jgi:hypothetical protein
MILQSELRSAGIVSLGLAVVALGGFFALWWFYVLYVLGSAIGVLVGYTGIRINRSQQRRCGIAMAGVLANLAVLGFFLYIRITHGEIVD